MHEAVSLPLVVQDEVRYVLYADNAPLGRPIGPLDALESAAARAARIIEKTLLARVAKPRAGRNIVGARERHGGLPRSSPARAATAFLLHDRQEGRDGGHRAWCSTASCVAHMVGNLQVYLGPEAINAYGAFLHHFLHGQGL